MVASANIRILENMGFETKSHRITELAESVEDNGGLVFVTAFSGLFAPYWIDDAQGTICTFLTSAPPKNHRKIHSEEKLSC